MTPAEHYAEAERLLDKTTDSLESLNQSVQRRTITTNTQMSTMSALVSIMVAKAHVHAVLATGPTETRVNHYHHGSIGGAA